MAQRRKWVITRAFEKAGDALEASRKVLESQAAETGKQMDFLEDLTQIYNSYTEQLHLVEQKDSEIERLSEQIRLLQENTHPKHPAVPSSQLDYHNLNIKYNDLRNENERLKREIEELKSKKRPPLNAARHDPPNAQNILTMMKTPARPLVRPKQEPQDTQLPPIQVHNPISFNIDPQSAAKSDPLQPLDSDSSDITPTQLSLHDHENIPPPDDEAVGESVIHPTQPEREQRRYSLDLGIGNARIPSSLPYQDSGARFTHSQSTDIPSSPAVRVKEEEEAETDDELLTVSQELTEVKDSQYDSEDDIAISLLTPKTGTKVHTPANVKVKQHHNLKRSLIQLQTPSEATPFKRPKQVKEEPTPTQLPRSQQTQLTEPTQPTQCTQPADKLDLTNHPYLHRPWIPEDFRVNPAKNGGFDHAYHVVLRGAARRCIHGTTCQDCDKFYEQMGDLPDNYNGPAWDNSKKKFDIVKTTSRHRDQWKSFEEPAGFAQFDFPSTQEKEKNRKISEKRKLKMAYERLYSCFHDQKYIFKKNEFNDAITEDRALVDEEVYLNYLETVQE